MPALDDSAPDFDISRLWVVLGAFVMVVIVVATATLTAWSLEDETVIPSCGIIREWTIDEVSPNDVAEVVEAFKAAGYTNITATQQKDYYLEDVVIIVGRC